MYIHLLNIQLQCNYILATGQVCPMKLDITLAAGDIFDAAKLGKPSELSCNTIILDTLGDKKKINNLFQVGLIKYCCCFFCFFCCCCFFFWGGGGGGGRGGL